MSKGPYSFDVPPPTVVPPLEPGESHMGTFPGHSPGKSNMDKLIDINHHLMKRVEELEEQNRLLIESNLRRDMERMRGADD